MTTSAIATVTPMIWLNVPCCSVTPGIALTALVDGVGVGGAAGRGVDRVGEVVAVAAHDQRLEHVRSELGVGTVGAQGVAPGVGRRPQARLTVEVRVRDEPDDLDRRAGRADLDDHALLDAVGLDALVGPRLAVRRCVGHAVGCEFVAEQRDAGEITRSVARHSGAELDVADPADLGDALDGFDLSAEFGIDPAAHERCLRGVRVHDGVGVLGSDGPGRRGDQAVEQAAEEHQEDRDQREDHRGGGEAAGAAAEFLQRELHDPTPWPVVASIGSMLSTRRAATSELSTPSDSRSTDQKITAAVSNCRAMPPSACWETG